MKEVGFIGEVHPYIRSSVLDTTEPVVLFEINLDALRRYERATVRYRSPSKFPSVTIDIALIVDKTITSHLMQETIRATGGPLLHDAFVFDVYEG